VIHRFRLDIDADTWQNWYRGSARRVRVRTETGLILEFPAEHLRAFVSHDGIHGRFELVADEHNRFRELRRIAERNA